jgi:hypothetical protein
MSDYLVPSLECNRNGGSLSELPFIINAFSHFISIFFMATSELCYLSCFLVHHQPPFLTEISGTLQDIALGGPGRKWYIASPLVYFLIFFFFFFFC